MEYIMERNYPTNEYDYAPVQCKIKSYSIRKWI